MSFFRRILNTVKTSANNIVQAIYQSSVNAFTSLMGLPNQEQLNQMSDPPVINQPVVDEIIEDEENEEDDDWIELPDDPAEVLEVLNDAIDDVPLASNSIILFLLINTGEEKEIPLNARNRADLKNSLELAENAMVGDMNFVEARGGSDAVTDYAQYAVTSTHYKIEDRDAVIINRRRLPGRTGGFFPYTHNIKNAFTSDLLKSIGIYSKNLISDAGKQDSHFVFSRCLVESLRDQLTPDKFEQLNDLVKTDFINQACLGNISRKIKSPIKLLFHREGEEKRRSVIYNAPDPLENDSNIPTICIRNGHYFRYIEDTGITKFFIHNIDKVIGCPKAHRANKIKADGTSQFTTKAGMDSWQLVRELVTVGGLLSPINLNSVLSHPDNYKESKKNGAIELNQLLNIDNSTSPIEFKDKHDPNRFLVLDFETFCDDKNVHRPYMISVYGKNDLKKIRTISNTFRINPDKDLESEIDKMIIDCFAFIGEQCSSGPKPKDRLLIFCHNLTYDLSFLLKHTRFCNESPLINNGRFVSHTCDFKYGKGSKVYILFKDSCRIIPERLSKIPKMLGIEGIDKEVMYYEVYNHKTMGRIDRLRKTEIKKYVDQFSANALNKDEAKAKEKDWWKKIIKYRRVDGTYNLMNYAQYYCERDVELTFNALIKFNQILNKIEPRMPPVWVFYSLPSIAQYYFHVNDCYQECYNMNGLLARYFNQFVVGGRVMLRDNKPQHRGNQDDFDACSLYPSAMRNFDGFLKGAPKVINEDVDLTKVDYYYVRVRITKVGKDRHFPLSSVFDGMTRDWTNDLVGKIIPLDKVGLEDLVKFQEVEYDIVDGYYFDDGFNTTIKDVIKVIYDRRRKEKRAGNNGLQAVLKLLMNSSYGKLIQKPNDTNYKLIRGEEYKDQYIKHKYHYISDVKSIGVPDKGEDNKYLVKEYTPVVESMSAPHLGCQVLSWSKRLMNQVMCCAEDNDYHMVYQDTDSIHIDRDKVNLLSQKFREEYGKELIGDDLGQFHCDFDVAGLDASTTYSNEFIGLAKKTYIDHCFDSQNNDGYHIRAKGLPNSSVLAKCAELGVTPLQLYSDLFHGKVESYQMNMLVDNAVMFQKDGDFTHSTRTEFTRTLAIKSTEPDY